MRPRKKKPPKRNPYAKALSSLRYRKRIVAVKKRQMLDDLHKTQLRTSLKDSD
jgi:hypothetical protein